MPFLLSHSFGAASVASLPFFRKVPPRIWWLAALCGAVPDFDYAWNLHSVRDESWLAHRGLTHTPLFAAVFAAILVWIAFRSADCGTRIRAWIALFLATASHGVFDAMSAYGRGIPFFFPFSSARYHLPWRPIRAGPHGDGLVSVLLRSIRTELLVIWIPGLILLGLTALRRQRFKSRAPA
jgi:inner membrane protein